LVNFEPSVEGGYKRILGYTKFDTASVPPYGTPVVQGSGQTGSNLVIADIFETPSIGDTLTIAGVTGTYTVAAVSFDSTAKNATLSFSTSMASSPADKAIVTFTNNTNLIEGLVYFEQKAIVSRGSNIWSSTGTGWTKVNTPSYGTVLVNGGSQTGTSLIVDGLTSTPQQGDTFTIAGVQKVYAITSSVTVTSGGATLTINPALASSPADNAAITFRSSGFPNSTKIRFDRYDFTGSPTIVGVDSTNLPFKYSGSTFSVLSSAPADVLGSSHVAQFKNHLFFAKGTNLTFTAPYSDTDFSSANGSGIIKLAHSITGIIVFREQLIIFSTNQIHRLVGNTISDFQLQPISNDIGCVRTDTIQEVGGDIAFLGPDGVRLLSATDKIGDFGFAVASRPIQSEVSALVSSNTSFTSCVIRGKNQYRLFGYSANRTPATAIGVLATQFVDQAAMGMAWSELNGILAYVADSIYSSADSSETILFANKDGYVYRLESGNSFDGSAITAQYFTPHLTIGDPRVRKTFYRLSTYFKPGGSISGTVSPVLNFNQSNTVQPAQIFLTNVVDNPNFFGAAVYGTATYGGVLTYNFISQMVGSSLTISLQYTFGDIGPPFSLDAITIEYLNNDRQ
jgi:hypothetical protein